jgi:hypothetical protein
MNDVSQSRTRRNLGLVCRRELLVPTRRGWLLLLLATIILGILLLRSIQPFLAVSAPVSGGLLVAEGWLADYALQAAVDEYERGAYEGFHVTGVPLEKGAPLSEYRTYAELGAAVVIKLGLATNEVHAVPAPDVRQDRTYASAVALKRWLAEQGRGASVLTVVSVGAHARRTRLLYEKAFGAGTVIGIIAVPDREYEAQRWWASSSGVRDVVDETVAYLYARFVFRPPKDRSPP